MSDEKPDDRKKPSRYEFTCVEALNHRVMMEQANALGADGWQMITTDRPHEFWIGVFQRERVDGADPFPTACDHTGIGVFTIAGGDLDGRLVEPDPVPVPATEPGTVSGTL